MRKKIIAVCLAVMLACLLWLVDVYKRQPKDSEEWLEAKRLLKFLDYFIGVSSEDIPKNSILREFIGGSCLNV